MKCQKCGTENGESARFCVSCGSPIEQAQNTTLGPQYTLPTPQPAPAPAPQPTPIPQPAPQTVVNVAPVIPPEYKPIGMWGYFGYQILFAIPCVGFIFLIIFALGGTQNINLKNFARSYFCVLVLALIFAVIILVLVGGVAGLQAVYSAKIS